MRRAAKITINRLLRHPCVNAVAPLLPPKAAVFDAAEWCRDRKLFVGVDPHRTGVDGTSNPPSLPKVLRVDTARQPVGVVIALADNVILILKREHGKYRSKNFIAAQAGTIGEAAENSRPVIRAFRIVTAG